MVASTVLLSHAQAAAISRRAEARRRFAVNAVFAIYALSLLEGALRKWFLPSLSTPLIFARDPFVALLYAYCFRHGLVMWGPLARLWLGMAVISSLVGLLQYQFNDLSPFGWILGVRTYWMYVPLAFVVAASFRRHDVQRFLLWNVLLAIPYAALVAAQYSAGPTAWINIGVGGDDSMAVGLGADIVRPFGLFTYTSPNVDFTAASVAIFIAFYLSGERMRFRTPILCASGVAVGAMAILTGSRTIYFLVAAIIGLTLGGSTIARPDSRTLARNFGILLFVGIAASMFLTAFPDMFAAMELRFERAAHSEGSIWDRAFGGIFSFADPLLTAPLIGHGIGIGAPGVANYLRLPPLLLGESDLQRNINELGVILGMVFILMRFSTAVWLAWTAVKLARRKVPMALPLAGYAIVPIAVGQLTHSPLNAFLPWLIVGICMQAHITCHWTR